ncbi:nuclear transport factor 2 family protein [Aliikangiella maris]|uniref:Nuclear transport factor 2 family protein n=2 Tax=Aliikangiella maris TaxID=3162458 RepID=A0ABV3MNJ1_9GAMM
MMIERFKSLYQQLDAENVTQLDTVYADNICFVDPFHRVEGIDNLKNYFARLYKNVQTIEFVFDRYQINQDSFFIQWTMRLQHPKLNKNELFEVPGITYCRYADGKITFHRDYFDAGLMFYEKLPMIGRVVRWLKKQL